MVVHRRNPVSLDQLMFRWVRILPAAGPQLRKAFAVLVRTSPQHLQAYLDQKVLSTELKGLDRQRQVDVQLLINRVRGRGNVIPWPGNGAIHRAEIQGRRAAYSNSGRAGGWIAFALSAGALICAPPVLQWRSEYRAVYATNLGERKSVQLPDGSTMQLNTESRVQLELTPTARAVQLTQGEALFSVRHDRKRPFQVRVGGILIQDIGTRFDVRIQGSDIRISVAEGRVSLRRVTAVPQSPAITNTVAPIELDQGEEATLPMDADRQEVQRLMLTPLQIIARTSWTRGVVTFTGQTLMEAAAELNRYNSLHLEVADQTIADLRLGGTFSVTDPLTFVAALTRFGVGSDAAKALRTHSRIIHLRRVHACAADDLSTSLACDHKSS